MIRDSWDVLERWARPEYGNWDEAYLATALGVGYGLVTVSHQGDKERHR